MGEMVGRYITQLELFHITLESDADSTCAQNLGLAVTTGLLSTLVSAWWEGIITDAGRREE